MAMGGLMMRKFGNKYYKKNEDTEMTSLEELEEMLDTVSGIFNEKMLWELEFCFLIIQSGSSHNQKRFGSVILQQSCVTKDKIR